MGAHNQVHLLQIKCVFIVLKDFPDDSCCKLILKLSVLCCGEPGLPSIREHIFLQSYHGFPSPEMARLGAAAAALPG